MDGGDRYPIRTGASFPAVWTKHLHCLWWYPEPLSLLQILTAIGAQGQTRFPAAAQAQSTPGSLLAVRVTQMVMAPVMARPLVSTMAKGSDPEPRHSCGPWWRHTGHKNIITDPNCYRTTVPDMVIGSSPGADVSKALDGSKGHSDRYHPNCRVSLGPQHDPHWDPLCMNTTVSGNRSY